MQDDLFAALDSVTVCPLTTTVVDAPLLRVPITSTAVTGLDADSYAMVDKLTTVKRTNNVGDAVGELTAQQLADIERRVLVFLGIAR